MSTQRIEYFTWLNGWNIRLEEKNNFWSIRAAKDKAILNNIMLPGDLYFNYAKTREEAINKLKAELPD